MKQISITAAEQMDEMMFLSSLEQLGTLEDLTDIITYLTSARAMTTQRLGYLLYFAYAWGLVIFHREIAPMTFMQTAYGPIEMMHSRVYPNYDLVKSRCKKPALDERLRMILDCVLSVYGNEPIRDLEIRLGAHMMDIEPGRTIGARDIFIFFSKAAHDGGVILPDPDDIEF